MLAKLYLLAKQVTSGAIKIKKCKNKVDKKPAYNFLQIKTSPNKKAPNK